jgi:hypothetical protein|tara:strand:- start:15 stop:401 length:387 start_codon:yes stop_codon:yes gene_type:complete
MTKYLAKVDNNIVVDVTRFSDEDYNLGIDHCKNLINDAASNYLDCEKGVSIGYGYDSDSNTFYAPQPYASWTLDVNFAWQPPVAKPDKGLNGAIKWIEANTRWEGLTNADTPITSTYWDPSDSTWKNI